MLKSIFRYFRNRETDMLKSIFRYFGKRETGMLKSIFRYFRNRETDMLKSIFRYFRNRETDMLKSQISILKGTIRREEEKANDLEIKCEMFSHGEYKAEDQEKMLKQLNKKVEEVYR